MFPKLKFKINYKKDIQTFFAFVNEASFDNGRNLEWAILKKYPQFRKYKKGNKLDISSKALSEFVKSVYFKDKKIIDKNINSYSKNWEKIEKDFFLLVNNLFDGYNWPKGKYITYPTIWGMYPRFLEDKTFQIPHKYKNKRYVNVIIAHEMLHFMFYDYFYKKYPKYKTNKYNFFVWNISEILNVIIQNSPKWLRIFKIKSIMYPEHKKIIDKLQKKYYKKNNINVDNLIQNIIEELKLF